MAIPPHLRSLKPGMAEKLGYYVYLYVDPRDGKVFYIGKGAEHGVRPYPESRVTKFASFPRI
jgi:hypothetical protein